MAEADLLQLLPLALGAIAVATVVYVLSYPFLSGEHKVDKRMKGVTATPAMRNKRVAAAEQTNQRKQTVSDTLADLEARKTEQTKRVSMRVRLLRAGLTISPNAFYAFSIAGGLGSALALFIAMPTAQPIALACVAFIGVLGVPRWVLNFLTKKRQKKFMNEFANAIDVIVRGVKSGLPLNECFGIIARESPEPIRSEFRELIDQQRVGVSLQECFDRMMHRMPISEVRFFGIVVIIQQQAGGNLSEALGNLASVLRDRKALVNKVNAMSAEAKASAYVLGCLPLVVILMVYITTPAYISVLFTERFGHFLLLISGLLMAAGVFVMKKMISFKY